METFLSWEYIPVVIMLIIVIVVAIDVIPDIMARRSIDKDVD